MEWISVKDRLPEKGNPVSVVVEHMGSVRVGLGYCEVYRDEFRQWEDVGGFKINVTHWMPLPEPPKEKDDE